MTGLVSRTGRQFQRYDKGRRLVVGSIPYRYINGGVDRKKVEVLVISSQKGHGILFPKGGWEVGESVEEAASRETLEEAGVLGTIQHALGSWSYKSKTQNVFHQGYMFAMLVTQQLDDLWPEKHTRQRLWLNIEDARDLCRDWWMKEALERLIEWLEGNDQDQGGLVLACSDHVDCFLEPDCIAVLT